MVKNGVDKRTSGPGGAGHRERLRRRFEGGGPAALGDGELLELLLTFAIARKDVRPAAGALLQRFGSLAGVLAAARERLAEAPGLGGTSALLLGVVRAVAARALEGRLRRRRRIASPEDVVEYLCWEVGHLDRERVLLLCLDAGGRLVECAVLAQGTVTQAPVYPREVARVALAAGAAAVLLVHNHPGGQCAPSETDRALTRELRETLAKLDIRLHDHLVVAENTAYSIASEKAYPCRPLCFGDDAKSDTPSAPPTRL